MRLSQAPQIHEDAVSRGAPLDDERKSGEAEQPAPEDGEAVAVVDDAGAAEAKRVARHEGGGDKEGDWEQDAGGQGEVEEVLAGLAVPADADVEPEGAEDD